MNGIKLEIALQNLRGLCRRHKQAAAAVIESRDKIDAMRAHAARMLADAASLEADMGRYQANVTSIGEYRDEVEVQVRKLYFELHGGNLVDVSPVQATEVYIEFLKKNRIGDLK